MTEKNQFLFNYISIFTIGIIEEKGEDGASPPENLWWIGTDIMILAEKNFC